MKPDERKNLLRDRGGRDIETKCMQEVAERHRGRRITGGRTCGEANGGKLTYVMKPNGCRKLKGTLGEEKVRY